MIRSITVTNCFGDSIKLDLARPELSGFAVEEITGLGPGAATINTTELSTMNGSLYNSARLPSRNIVLSLKYLWNPTIEDTRQLSYKYFPIMKKIKLLIETDNRVAEIEGYVESNEPEIFSDSEGTDISIVCPNPFFYSAGDRGVNVTLFSSIEPEFEFPFSDDTFELSSYRATTEKTIFYDGDSEIGITIHIHSSGDVTNITIANVETRESMTINTDKMSTLTGSGIVDGDKIVICTVQGAKSVTLIRNGELYNILNCLDRDADWFKLSKGNNTFAYNAETGVNNLSFEIQNRVIYEGV